MTIGDVGQVAQPTEYSVTLSKGQEKQQAVVVDTLIESTKSTAPDLTGVGGKLNAVA